MLSQLQLTSSQKRIFAISWITYAMFSLGRVNFSTALPAIAVSLGVSRAEVGVIGTIIYWTYASGQFINGEVGNHLNPRRIVTIGLLVVAAANLLFALQTSLVVMAVLWGINGFAQSSGWPPIMRIIAEHFDATERKHISPYLAMSYMAGTAFTWAVTGWLIDWQGWQAAFLVSGLVLLVLAAVWWYSRVDAPVPAVPNQGFRLKEVRHELVGLSPLLLAIALFGFVHVGSNIWMPTYFVDTELFPESLVGVIAGIVPLFGIIGMLLSGFLLRHLEHVLKVIGLMLISSVVGLMISAQFHREFQVISILFTMLLIKGASGLLVTSLPIIIAPTGRTSSVAGSLNAALNLGGGLAGVALGAITEHHDWDAVFWIWAGCLVMTLILIRLAQNWRFPAATL